MARAVEDGEQKGGNHHVAVAERSCRIGRDHGAVVVGVRAGVVTQRELSLAAANLMAEAAVEHCRKGGFRISVTIVDSGGQIRLFHKDDGANPHTVDASFRKAYTARTYRVPSADFMKRTEVGAGGRPGLRAINNTIGVPAGCRSRSATRPSAGSASPARRATRRRGLRESGIARVQDQLKCVEDAMRASAARRGCANRQQAEQLIVSGHSRLGGSRSRSLRMNGSGSELM